MLGFAQQEREEKGLAHLVAAMSEGVAGVEEVMVCSDVVYGAAVAAVSFLSPSLGCLWHHAAATSIDLDLGIGLGCWCRSWRVGRKDRLMHDADGGCGRRDFAMVVTGLRDQEGRPRRSRGERQGITDSQGKSRMWTFLVWRAVAG